jgi:hypothetical protein
MSASSLLASDTNSDLDKIPPLRPLQPELPPSFWDQHGWLIGLGSAAVLALLAGAIWWLTRPRPPVIISAAVQARQGLEPLRPQPEDGLLLSRISQILRHYIAETFALPSGELNTTEFCRAIAAHPHIGPKLSIALTEFLRRCDERKFAPAPPAPPLDAVAQAFQFIDQAEARRESLAQAAAQIANHSPETSASTSKNL